MASEHLRHLDTSLIHKTQSPRIRRWQQQFFSDPIARTYGRNFQWRVEASERILNNPIGIQNAIADCVQRGDYATPGAVAYQLGLPRRLQKRIIQIGISNVLDTYSYLLTAVKDKIDETLPKTASRWNYCINLIFRRGKKITPEQEALIFQHDVYESMFDQLYYMQEDYIREPSVIERIKLSISDRLDKLDNYLALRHDRKWAVNAKPRNVLDRISFGRFNGR